MFKLTMICTNDHAYELNALLTNNEYHDVSLEFYIDDENIDTWDNEDYLINDVYPYLKGEKQDDELDDIFSNVKNDVLEIFEEAIRMKFFKL